MTWPEFIKQLPINESHVTLIINWCGKLLALIISIIGAALMKGFTLGWGDKFFTTQKKDKKNDERRDTN